MTDQMQAKLIGLEVGMVGVVERIIEHAMIHCESCERSYLGTEWHVVGRLPFARVAAMARLMGENIERFIRIGAMLCVICPQCGWIVDPRSEIPLADIDAHFKRSAP